MRIAISVVLVFALASANAFAGGNFKSSELLVSRGFFAKTQNPGCIGDYSKDPSAKCEKICVTLGPSERVTRVHLYLKSGNDEDYQKVRPNEAYKKAKFAGEHTINEYTDSTEVCATIMNWNTRTDVQAMLEVEYN